MRQINVLIGLLPEGEGAGQVARVEIVVDGKGSTKVVRPIESTQYPDKKTPIVDETRILAHLVEARRLYRDMETGQREATVELHPKFPDQPVYIWLNTDDHMGSVMTDYELFLKDYQTVLDTPNFYALSNGDEVDHFMVTAGKAATGVYEDPITPQQQGFLFQSLFRHLDQQGKCLGFSFGNHNQWLRGSCYKFENTWLRDFTCPVLNCGGVIHVRYGTQTYDIAVSHMHWGSSKLNPTNAAKRMLEHDYPDSDIVFLGHVHLTEVLSFDRGGKDRLAIIGGTYKIDDEFGSEHGLGSARGNLGGVVLALSPNERRMRALRHVWEAEEDFNLRTHGQK